MRWMMIARAATSSSMITRQSPTPKTGLRAALQLSHLGSSWVVGESPDRAEHPLLDLRVKSFEILVGAPFELDGPRLCGHEPPCLRMISA
jgi:hypothetical protein